MNTPVNAAPSSSRLRRRNSMSASVVLTPGDNKPARLPSYERQLDQLLQDVTQGRVRIVHAHNSTDRTEFVLTPTALEPGDRAAIETAVARRLHALWSCEERTCHVPGAPADADTGSAGAVTPRMHRSGVARMQWQPTLVVSRMPASELPRPLWLTAGLATAGAALQSACLYGIYWIWTL
jgi:hypothetical protein